MQVVDLTEQLHALAGDPLEDTCYRLLCLAELELHDAAKRAGTTSEELYVFARQMRHLITRDAGRCVYCQADDTPLSDDDVCKDTRGCGRRAADSMARERRSQRDAVLNRCR